MAEGKNLAQIKLKTSDLKPGDLFRHYKGGEFEVVTLAVKEDTLEALVVYRSLTKGSVWVRSCQNWGEDVEVDGKKMKRFEKLA